MSFTLHEARPSVSTGEEDRRVHPRRGESRAIGAAICFAAAKKSVRFQNFPVGGGGVKSVRCCVISSLCPKPSW